MTQEKTTDDAQPPTPESQLVGLKLLEVANRMRLENKVVWLLVYTKGDAGMECSNTISTQ
jgi:hypothetical protein